ncbi:MAG: TenA family protein [Phyllobacteriaceae bacterium]|nr:TenA family protein [Phyllobacteriaceae bacterium]
MDLFDRLRAARPEAWRAYVEHRFVADLGDGTLPKAAFDAYLVQDWLFLIQFARAYALAVYKGRDLADMRAAQAGLAAILDVEMDLHVRLCERRGIPLAVLETTPEHRATVAYTRFVLDTGLRGDLLDLHVALAPCIVGYAEIATRLMERPGALDPANPYAEWIVEYAGDVYLQVARAARTHLDRLAERSLTEARFADLAEIFARASLLEADFWSMGLEAAVD